MLNRTDRPRLARAARLVALTLWLALLLPAPAQALTLTAATEAELSAAISTINAAGAGNHTITLTADITLTGPLPPLDNIAPGESVIEGAGHTLTGDDAHTILVVTPETAARLSNLTLTGGRGSSGPDAARGGAIYTQGFLRLEAITITGNTAASGGGIVLAGIHADNSESTLTIVDSIIADNHATQDGGGLFMPGDYGYFSRLTVTNTVISGNSAGANGGAVAGRREIGYSYVAIGISGSRLYNNTAAIDGGAFFLSRGMGELTLTNTSVYDNEAGRDGGAISVEPPDLLSYEPVITIGVTLNNSALYRNRAGAKGGAYANYGNTDFSATNSTISGNEAAVGGGLYSYSYAAAIEAIHLSYTTVAGNSATSGGGIFVYNYFYGDGGDEYVPPEVVLASSIISGNSGGDCLNVTYSPAEWRSAGYNLDSDGSCGLRHLTDRPEANAALLPLADNGGPTPTHALGEISAALDLIPPGVGGCPATDQRGVARPQRARCDSGAYELEGAPLDCSLPLTAADADQLTRAILCVNRAGTGQHAITLTADITLTSLLPALNNPEAGELLIEATGFTLTGDAAHTVLTVAPRTNVRLRGLTITNGLGSSGKDGQSAGGIYNLGRLTVTDTTIRGNRASHGGGIYNRGELTVEESRLSDNTAVNGGGGVFNIGALTLRDSRLSGNSATAGGGIAALAQSVNATLTLVDSHLDGNTAETGGGVYAYADGTGSAALSLSNTLFEANTATVGGGAIDLFANGGRGLTAIVANSRFVDNSGGRGGALGAHAKNGQLAISVGHTTFSDNEAGEGGAVALIAESVGTTEARLTQTTLSNNRATGIGGGAIYTYAAGQGTADLTVLNATLSGNHAGSAGGGLRVSSDGGTATANVSYSTLAFNTAPTGGGIHVVSATGSPAEVTLSATIITNEDGAGPDCARPSGSIISTGFNLAGDGTCYLNKTSDLPASAAGLLPLVLNAPGDTPTHALLLGSPAGDHIPPGSAGCGTAVTVDQRGAPRPQSAGGRCDIGAFERQENDLAGFGVYLPLAVKGR